MTKSKTKEISAADYLPEEWNIPSLKEAAKNCHGCHLYKNATQTVFGSGSEKAKLMVVGEIPGMKEDLTGIPFTGPAGMFLRKNLQSSGIDLDEVYFTNVVKHFKFTYMNKRKLHRSPVGKEIRACKPWLEAEIEVVKPKVILCLGLIAAQVLVDKQFHIREQRGQWFENERKIRLMATFHPSAILRAVGHESREEMKKMFLKDIKKVVVFLTKPSAKLKR